MAEVRRSALVVANDEYHDRRLRRLRAPAADAAELARVLSDPDIGGFEVDVSVNEPEYVLRRQLSAFFDDRGIDDVLLLHLSCHGLKDEDGRLYFATPDTEVDHLEATAISSDFVNRQMTRSRSRRIVLLLDCCYSGAFARGLMSRAGDRVDILERFDGRGRIILTASSAMEYSFEGDQLTGTGQPSVFTSALVEGLSTGEADRNRDGYVSVDELYEFAYDRVRAVTPSQTPGKWVFDLQGDFYIARSTLAPEPAAGLPEELYAATKSPFAHVRAGAIEELAGLLDGPDRALATAARARLEELVNDDSQRVSLAVAQALAGPVVPPPAAVRDVAVPDVVAPVVEPGVAEPGVVEPLVEPEVAEPVATDPGVAHASEPGVAHDTVAALAAAVSPAAVSPAAVELPGDAEPPAPARLVLPTRLAAVALLAALPLPLLAVDDDHWNAFAVIPPFEVVAAAVAVWVLSRWIRLGRASMSLAAGLLTVVGALTGVASIGFVKFSIQRIDAVAIVLSLIALLAAVAIAAAGVACLRALPTTSAPAGQVDRTPLLLALAATGLLCVALVVHYDGYSSLWTEVEDGYSAEFFFEPLAAAIAAVCGVVALRERRRLASAVLVTTGGLAAVHYLGVLIAAARAVGEVGDVKSAWFVGCAGGVLAVVAGRNVRRSLGPSAFAPVPASDTPTA